VSGACECCSYPRHPTGPRLQPDHIFTHLHGLRYMPSSNLRYDPSLISFAHFPTKTMYAFLFVPNVPQVSPISTKVITGEGQALRSFSLYKFPSCPKPQISWVPHLSQAFYRPTQFLLSCFHKNKPRTRLTQISHCKKHRNKASSTTDMVTSSNLT